MKLGISILMSSAVLAIAAPASFAGGHVSYGVRQPRISTIDFPGYGAVPGNLICVTADKQVLKAAVPASIETICTKSEASNPNNYYLPSPHCLKWERVSFPAVDLERPVEVLAPQCVAWDHFRDSHPTCVKTELKPTKEPLFYRVETPNILGDYGNNPSRTVVSIPVCQ